MSVSLWITTEPNRRQSQRVWRLQSGSMAIFAVADHSAASAGRRRYLFTVSANDALFEISAHQQCGYRILAIALEEIILTELNPDQLMLRERLQLASRWSQQLNSIMANMSAPITLNADALSDWNVLQTEFKTWHARLCEYLKQLEQQEYNQALSRLQQREQLNHWSVETALEGLVNVVQPQSAYLQTEESALLAAAGAVGHKLGITIQAPASSENWAVLADPVEVIARASRIRVRRITLEPDWWQQDLGPFLGYLREDERPVALLPIQPGRYALFDPATSTCKPLGGHMAALLSPIAYTFYPSFPDKILSTWEVAKFVLQGQTNDLINIVWIGIAGTLVGMFTPLVTGLLIDQAIPDANKKLLLQIGFGLLAASIGVAVFQLAQRQVLLRVQATTDLSAQAAVWDRLLKLKLTFFRQYSTGELTNRVMAVSKIQMLLNGATLPTLFSSFFALLNLLLLFAYSFNLAWIAVIVAAIALLINNTVRLLANQQFRSLEALEGDLFGTLVQIIGGISKLRVAGAEDRAFAFWANQYRQQLRLVVNTQFLEDCLTVFNRILPTVSSIFFFWFASALTNPTSVDAENLSTGAFLAFNAAFGAFILGATSLSDSLPNLLQAKILWERARPILEAEPEVDNSKADPGRLIGHLKLDRVTFRYRSDGPLILDQVTLEAKPGEFIALVGPSGSGKSTIMRLMLGFETSEQGTIYYNDQDLSELDLTAVRRQLGVVLQNGRITSASLLENIAAGALITLNDAWEAATLAGFADDIKAMPMGMHTIISEGGSNLSGGQRQRLLIARALVSRPKILILDEATSALDNQTQAIISQNLEQMQVTRIAIAHRLSTIRHADRIYVLDQGRVVQQGTFEQLVNQPGLFQRMMARQMA